MHSWNKRRGRQREGCGRGLGPWRLGNIGEGIVTMIGGDSGKWRDEFIVISPSPS